MRRRGWYRPGALGGEPPAPIVGRSPDRRSHGAIAATPGSPGSPSSPHRSGAKPGTRPETADSACRREVDPLRNSTTPPFKWIPTFILCTPSNLKSSSDAASIAVAPIAAYANVRGVAACDSRGPKRASGRTSNRIPKAGLNGTTCAQQRRRRAWGSPMNAKSSRSVSRNKPKKYIFRRVPSSARGPPSKSHPPPWSAREMVATVQARGNRLFNYAVSPMPTATK